MKIDNRKGDVMISEKMAYHIVMALISFDYYSNAKIRKDKKHYLKQVDRHLNKAGLTDFATLMEIGDAELKRRKKEKRGNLN